MILVGRERLTAFVLKHADARKWIDNWLADAQGATWRCPQDIKNRYRSATFLADCVIVFNVKGNDYRLEVQVAFKTGKVVVKWAGPHAEYTKRCKER